MEGRGGEMIVIGSECGGGGRGGRILPQQAQSVRSPPPSASVRPSASEIIKFVGGRKGGVWATALGKVGPVVDSDCASNIYTSFSLHMYFTYIYSMASSQLGHLTIRAFFIIPLCAVSKKMHRLGIRGIHKVCTHWRGRG